MAKKAKYYVRPDGLHESIRLINGKRVAFRGKSDREVDRKILEFQEQREHGRPFPEVADEWFREREREISISTWRVYGFALERVKAAFPGFCGEIRPIDVQRYVKRFEAQGYSKGTVQIELSVIKQIFSYAVLQGDIDVSPAAEAKKSRGLAEKKRSSLTEEQEAMVETCRTGKWWLLGLMLLYTGCRRGELLALEWKDIDRKAGVIHVTKKLNYAYGNHPHLENFLKNHHPHDVPLLPPLAAALPTNRVGKIFTGKSRDGYMTGSELDRAWKEYCRDCGLAEITTNDAGEPEYTYPITPHCFRHSFATICFEAGIDPKATAEFMGDTEKIVQQVYTDLRRTAHKSAADKLKDYVAARRAQA